MIGIVYPVSSINAGLLILSLVDVFNIPFSNPEVLVRDGDLISPSSIINVHLLRKFETCTNVNVMIDLLESTSVILDEMRKKKFSNRAKRRKITRDELKKFTHFHQSDILQFLSTCNDIERVKGFTLVNRIFVQNANLDCLLEVSKQFGFKIKEIREQYFPTI